MKSLEFELREAVRASDLQAQSSCCWLLVMVFYLAFPLMVAVPLAVPRQFWGHHEATLAFPFDPDNLLAVHVSSGAAGG